MLEHRNINLFYYIKEQLTNIKYEIITNKAKLFLTKQIS